MRVIIEKNADGMSRWAANHIVERINALEKDIADSLNALFKREG